MKLTDKILKFWFGKSNIATGLKPRKVWFRSSHSFDQETHANFKLKHSDALAGRLDNMIENQNSCLALIILLDQFSRNLFRERPEAFEGVAKAQNFLL